MKIRHKITLWVVGSGLLTSLLFSLVVFWEMREQPLEVLDLQLKAMAADMAGQMAKKKSLLKAGQVNMIFLPSGRDWIRVYDQEMHPLYQSGLAEVVDLPLYRDKEDGAYTVTAHIPKGSVSFPQDEKGDVAFRVRLIMENIAGESRLIQVARPVEKLDEEIADLLAAIGIGLAVSTLLLVCVSYILAGQIIKPITLINRLAREINENTLEKRIPTGKSRDEISSLVNCMNQMFDRLQFSFSRQKQYLADASHELKSPIAMLRLFFEEAALRQDLPKVFQNQLHTQGRTVLRLDRLVKMLLELSVLEVKESLNPELFSLTDLARSVLEDFMPLIEKAKIHIETDLPEYLSMQGDKDTLRRALINIVDNAIKYNVENGQIKFVAAQKNNGIFISVYNTGPGIAEDDLENVFEQFYRVEKSRSLQYVGAGLGLAIVRKIVQLHGGTVKMESEEGVWARITILLPVNALLS